MLTGSPYDPGWMCDVIRLPPALGGFLQFTFPPANCTRRPNPTSGRSSVPTTKATVCPLTFSTDVTLAQVKESIFVPPWLFHASLETRAIYILHTLCHFKNVFDIQGVWDCYVHTSALSSFMAAGVPAVKLQRKSHWCHHRCECFYCERQSYHIGIQGPKCEVCTNVHIHARPPPAWDPFAPGISTGFVTSSWLFLTPTFVPSRLWSQSVWMSRSIAKRKFGSK